MSVMDAGNAPGDGANIDDSAKKRKRSSGPADEELEIDINLPEPPSKKAKRKEKKVKKPTNKAPQSTEQSKPVDEEVEATLLPSTTPATLAPTRSDFGIWIGNLPWTATKETLRTFLLDQGGIDSADIFRLHLPAPPENQNGNSRIKAFNKGFAYIDFSSQPILDIALGLSEKLLTGRPVLIKNAKSFEGRPEKPAGGANGGPVAKEPTKRIFVGNLSFDVTREELSEHFSQAGELEDVHMATFEDSGKCKGFAWLRFETLEAAEAAVKGFVFRGNEDDDDEDDDDEDAKQSKTKKASKKKWFINRLHGRTLRCEFAEDAQTRYKKRYGKGAATTGVAVKDRRDTTHDDATGTADGDEGPQSAAPPAERQNKPDKEARREHRRQRHDARTIAPGQALANAKRASEAIVAGAGKKVVFE